MPDGPSDLYDRDFYAWTQDQAARLRAWPEHLWPNGLDLGNLAEEIDSLGKSDRRAVESLLRQLLLHLLKFSLVRAEAPRPGWRREVVEFRARLARLLADSPSLAARAPEIAAEEWATVRRAALAELAPDGIRADQVPSDLPYGVRDQVLNPDWEPPAAPRALTPPVARRRVPARHPRRTRPAWRRPTIRTPGAATRASSR